MFGGTKMKFWKIFLAVCLAVIMLFSLAACGNDDTTADTVATEAGGIPVDGSTLGTGAHSFTFQVVMKDGKTYNYTVKTDAETVGEALQALELVDGDESEYGLFITTVLGVTLDYNTDGYFWSLSENGTDASVGADSLPVTDGSTYAFTATAAE